VDSFATAAGVHVITATDAAEAQRRLDQQRLEHGVDREQAERHLADIRSGALDAQSLDDSETSHLTRVLWQQEVERMQHWQLTSHWTESGFPNLLLPSPGPPPTLSDWSPALRRRHGLEGVWRRYAAAVAEVRRLSQQQNAAYDARPVPPARPRKTGMSRDTDTVE
jgi:hypothetical protein